jgi:hypothetical protein
VAVPFDCRPVRLPLRLDSQADATLAVSRGAPCALSIDPGSVAVDTLTVEAAPANGTLSPRGRTGVVYRPARSFAGEDAFTIAVTGHVGATAGTMLVRVRALVQ